MPRQSPMLRVWTNDEIKDKARQESVIGFGRGYLEDTLDKTSMTDMEEQVNEEEHHSKSVEDKGYQDMVHDFPQFAIPSFSLGVSQDEKEALPKGVVVDSLPDILAVAVQVINCDVEDVITRCVMTSAQCISTPLLPGPIMLCSKEDNDAFVDRSLMRIAKPNLHIRDVQTTTNTNKGKAVLVKAPKRCRTRSAPCSITEL
ncbi:hypothetical protein Cgig2_024285 [Carnegiea gigantea]|uniref:Uncharacterized protein n=1 Tax=Carnegiea gigantea TaxID=171969 RepID=A0A9Q1JN57_9CARY|nr:hypothetical protein Cgig2_024285 [Carnegiea gigantea]